MSEVKNIVNIQYYESKYGEFIIGTHEGKLCMLDYRYRKMRDQLDTRIKNHLNANFVEQNDALIDNVINQLEEYFNMKRKAFDIPILFLGSDFQKEVWNALLKVPYGSTKSYLELAINIGNEKAVRAVANANGANALSIVVPCHRIIGSNGKLTGYAGGLNTKKKLLQLEQNLFII